MTESVIEELMLHNRTCPQCSVGEPCLVAEHIHDCWPQRLASVAAASLVEITTDLIDHKAAAA
ncbi:hypothetical protein [Dyella caseinilytica]|uniref:Uncharacterized protein n=1 Tax=Dyella caseinilytica TaxID=1849581 RepID=A0ABX7GZ95_9GAMM|nr:hypothetical protein [Dyella caseinilytica]QRN55348.1 hypothetical protein ISN74_08505 [Dyella caseinilytica]GGA01075.1 hypothetical protein GCM10011408_22820 [Dyella caseinilytica]